MYKILIQGNHVPHLTVVHAWTPTTLPGAQTVADAVAEALGDYTSYNRVAVFDRTSRKLIYENKF